MFAGMIKIVAILINGKLSDILFAEPLSEIVDYIGKANGGWLWVTAALYLAALSTPSLLSKYQVIGETLIAEPFP